MKSPSLEKIRKWRIVGGCLLSLGCWMPTSHLANAQTRQPSLGESKSDAVSIARANSADPSPINSEQRFHVTAAFQFGETSEIKMAANETLDPHYETAPETTPIEFPVKNANITERYRNDLPNLPSVNCAKPTLLDDGTIIRLARQKSAVRKLLSRESLAAGLNTDPPKLGAAFRDSSINSSAELYQQFLRSQAVHQSQLSAENALKAHYGIRSLNRSIELITHLLNEIETQQGQLSAAMDKGLPVGDLTVLDRAKIDALSSLSDAKAKLAGLRSQLALLIGSEYACCYQPSEIDGALPTNDELCGWVDAGSINRKDLVAYRRLARCLTIENLDVARLASANITGNTAISTNLGRRWIYRLFRRSEETLEKELKIRRAQLNEYADFLQSRITTEIEAAWQNRASAIDRWNLAIKEVDTWQSRLEQLDEIDRLGKPDVQNLFTAELEYLRSQINVVERWNDYHQHNIQLLSSAGLIPCHN